MTLLRIKPQLCTVMDTNERYRGTGLDQELTHLGSDRVQLAEGTRGKMHGGGSKELEIGEPL